MGIGAMRCLSQIHLGAPEAFRHAPPPAVVLPLGRVPAIDTASEGRSSVSALLTGNVENDLLTILLHAA